MLSEEDLSRIVKDEIENEMRKGKGPIDFYYILLDGRIYPGYMYDKEVAEGKRSPNDIYAYVLMDYFHNLDTFLFYVNYLESAFVPDIVNAYLRKVGFTVEYYGEYSGLLSPTPNLKYFIRAGTKDNDTGPEYLVVSIYDIDALARSFRIPQIVQQKLGNQPRKVTYNDLPEIYRSVTKEQPLLASYTYYDAWYILDDYYVRHEEKDKDEAYKIDLAYMNLFPTPYEVCYEWKAGTFVETSCLKIELRRFSS